MRKYRQLTNDLDHSPAPNVLLKKEKKETYDAKVERPRMIKKKNNDDNTEETAD